MIGFICYYVFWLDYEYTATFVVGIIGSIFGLFLIITTLMYLILSICSWLEVGFWTMTVVFGI